MKYNLVSAVNNTVRIRKSFYIAVDQMQVRILG